VVACKTCNTIHKKNFFPVAGQRCLSSTDPTTMVAERAMLIYPVGDIDTNPAELIQFEGPLPLPATSSADSFEYWRARVTIELLGLDQREELLSERYEYISYLFGFLTTRRSQSRDAIISRLLSPQCRHSNCLNSFARLFNSDRRRARVIYGEADRFLNSKKGRQPS
jgi:hypothetical protein